MNIEKYNKLHNEIMNRLENGEITVETAKEVNGLAFDKYIMESGLNIIAKAKLKECAKLLSINEPTFIHPKDMTIKQTKHHDYFRNLVPESANINLQKYFSVPVENIYSYNGKKIFAYIYIFKKTDMEHLLYFKLLDNAFEKFANFYMAYCAIKTNSDINDESWRWINNYIKNNKESVATEATNDKKK